MYASRNQKSNNAHLLVMFCLSKDKVLSAQVRKSLHNANGSIQIAHGVWRRQGIAEASFEAMRRVSAFPANDGRHLLANPSASPRITRISPKMHQQASSAKSFM
jgi:hypothetical protein